MMLNILGLRMAGQMSLRKTKPLWKKGQMKSMTHSNLNSSMLAVTVALGISVPDNPGPHGGVVGPFLLHRLLQTAIDEP